MKAIKHVWDALVRLAVDPLPPEGYQPKNPPGRAVPPPENTREAFRRGTTPWNYSRPRPNQELLGQLDYLVQVHGPAEVEKRLRELAERKAKRDS